MALFLAFSVFLIPTKKLIYPPIPIPAVIPKAAAPKPANIYLVLLFINNAPYL